MRSIVLAIGSYLFLIYVSLHIRSTTGIFAILTMVPLAFFLTATIPIGLFIAYTCFFYKASRHLMQSFGGFGPTIGAIAVYILSVFILLVLFGDQKPFKPGNLPWEEYKSEDDYISRVSNQNPKNIALLKAIFERDPAAVDAAIQDGAERDLHFLIKERHSPSGGNFEYREVEVVYNWITYVIKFDFADGIQRLEAWGVDVPQGWIGHHRDVDAAMDRWLARTTQNISPLIQDVMNHPKARPDLFFNSARTPLLLKHKLNKDAYNKVLEFQERNKTSNH